MGKTEIKFSGTLGTLEITFVDGMYAGHVYEIPGDTLVGGRFVIYPNTRIQQTEPCEQSLTLEESNVIIRLLKPFTRYVEVR